MINKEVFFIAGPCAITYDNIEVIEQIANISINSKKVVAGTRVVGLKSRSELVPDSQKVGIDYDDFNYNLNLFVKTNSTEGFRKLPSITIANHIIEKYNMLVATEVMLPTMQMSLFDKYLPKHKFMVWNPAINQLGWGQLLMAKYCAKNDWFIGFKNAKTLGGEFAKINDDNYSFVLEKSWKGLTTFASDVPKARKILIHRGVEVPEKGDFRSALVHNIAKKVKKETGCKLFFDPSHSYGSKLRHEIPNAIIEALQIKIDEQEYLYDGILVETGFSITDNDQHISVSELKNVLQEVHLFRELVNR